MIIFYIENSVISTEITRSLVGITSSLDLDALKITLGIHIYPYTDLAMTAIEEGQITAHDNLLFPRFYIDQELKEWLEKYVSDRAKNRPNWFL
jgi:hypothetical protein